MSERYFIEIGLLKFKKPAWRIETRKLDEGQILILLDFIKSLRQDES